MTSWKKRIRVAKLVLAAPLLVFLSDQVAVTECLAADTTPPTVTVKTPAAGATGVSVNVKVEATFSESILPASLSFVLRNSSNVVVVAALTYDDATRTATLEPSSPLTGGQVYQATVATASDLAGNPLASPVVWSFTTAAPGFQDSVIFPGLTEPTVIQFASDGRVFVGEKSGIIKVFSSLNDTTGLQFADLRTNVHNFWDRGLLSVALHPNFPTIPYVYVLYTFDAPIGGTAPTWGTVGGTSDGCPTPPGPVDQGCVVSARLSRLTASATTGIMVPGSEVVLINDWFQQFPSHSPGTLIFGMDGALYASGGDGASFNYVDYGQTGNPAGDPPGPPGSIILPPTAEGGALRSQDLLTRSDPLGLDGTVIRIDPNTAQNMPDNPLAADPELNARRIIATGLRNPFRMTRRPGTNELWVGDVGWSTYEEINRIVPSTTTVQNFGWPCYEGVLVQPDYAAASLNLCTQIYNTPNSTIAPVFAYPQGSVYPGDPCPTGSKAITGLAFYEGTRFPANYQGALFFTDYARSCIWTMFAGADGLPDPATVTLLTFANNPVDLKIHDGDLYYASFYDGEIRRIRYFSGNQPPVAALVANPTSGNLPLTVTLNGSGSSDPDQDPLTYSWDLNGDGVFGDATTAQTSVIFTQHGVYHVYLKVTDPQGLSDVKSVLILAGNESFPTPSITTPSASLLWKAGDTINFSGGATDAQDGTLAPAALSWTLLLHHCPSTCHLHTVQTFSGVASGSFVAPDHEYPSFLELVLTATDSSGLQATVSRNLNPDTVQITIDSIPSGLTLTAASFTGVTPFTRQVIRHGVISISAPPTQLVGTSALYGFTSWNDAGAATHNTAPLDTSQTLRATYTNTGSSVQTLLTTQTPAGTFQEEVIHELGVRLVSDVSGQILALRFWKAPGEYGTHVGRLWNAAGALLAQVTFTGETTSGWQQQLLPAPISIQANTEYVVSVSSSASAIFAATVNGISTPITNGHLQSPGGRYGSPGTFPTITSPHNYFRDAVFATGSTVPDTQPPVVTNLLPANNSTVSGLVPVSVTATDDVGVVGVQFKVDGANLGSEDLATPYSTTWDSFTVSNGTHTVSATARDAAGHTTTATSTVTVSNTGQPPQTLLTTQVPAMQVSDNTAYELGARIVADTGGQFTAVRFWKSANETGPGPHVGRIWTAAGQLLASVTFTNESASGWQQQTLTSAVNVTANAEYVVSVNTQNYFPDTQDAFTTGLVNGHLSAVSGANGVFGPAGAFPTGSYRSSNYFRDVVFVANPPVQDTQPPVVTNLLPANNSTVSGLVPVSVTATDDVGVVGVQFKVDGANLGSEDLATPYSTTWDSFTVSNGTHTVSATARDAAGHTTTATSTVTVSNTGQPPQTLLTTQVPAMQVTDNTAYELGVRIVADTGGQFTAVRFWKMANETGPGPHVGRIWTAAGQLLGSVTFTNESASGWQQQSLTSAVNVTANTEYVVSVNTQNYFADTFDAFTTGLVNGHLSAVAGANGVSGPAGAFPTGSYRSSNYFRDVVFVANPPVQDTQPPVVTNLLPANNSTVSGLVPVSVTATDDVGVVGVQFKVDGANLGAEDQVAPYSTTWDSFTVSNGTHTVSATARDAAGHTTTATATVTVSNTGQPPQTLLTTQVPAMQVTDNTAYELGVRIVADTGGQFTAVRFWKMANETGPGPHVGRIWTAAGQLLGSVTFTNESASGWQQQTLTTAIPVTANTEYVVSVNTQNYFADTFDAFTTGLVNGHLSAVAGANGVSGPAGAFPTGSYRSSNYFRDVVFVANPPVPDTQPPVVTNLLPANNSTVSGLVPVSVTATDDVGVVGVQFKVDGANLGAEDQVAPYSTTWDSFTVSNGTHTVSATARDAAGHTTTATATVTVSNTGQPPQTLLTTQVPAMQVTDNTAYELGVRIVADTGGQFTAVRFWKMANETGPGPHVGRIWSAAGQLLGSVTFTNESASGWQQQTLTTAIPVTANTEYVVSVNTQNYFADTFDAFTTGLVNGHLRAVAGANGVSGPPGTFPTGSYRSSNYFRDVVFVAGP